MSFKNNLTFTSKLFFLTAVLTCGFYGQKTFKYFYRNYQGYCGETDVRFSDPEKIDRAIEHLFIFYPKDERKLNRFLKMEGLSQLELSSKKKPLLYKGVPDFLKINEDCCRVVFRPTDVEAAPATIFEKMTGSVSSFVEIKYFLRYTDDLNKIHAKKSEVTYAINNCGVVWNKN